MRALTASEVLSLWERTRAQRPLAQALACLQTAAEESDWPAHPIGHVCKALFRLRGLMYGSRMPGVVACPRCGERLEFSFECREIAESETQTWERLTVESGEHRIELRLPTAADVLAVRSAGELLVRCAGQPVDVSAELIGAASESVAQADPLAETLLDLTCPACAHQWQALLDIAVYFMQEVAHQAQSLLQEVHLLASAYGWEEQAILALNPLRRKAYLEMAGA